MSLDKPIAPRESWDRYFIRRAMAAAERSLDPSTKVGCVLVGEGHIELSTGYNGFPRGVKETEVRVDDSNPAGVPCNREYLIPERWERPAKYQYIEHAERNAIFNAARHGIKLLGCTAYLNYAPCPCESCARALIQVGCARIIGPSITFPGAGNGVHYDVEGAAKIMMQEAGIELVTIQWGE